MGRLGSSFTGRYSQEDKKKTLDALEEVGLADLLDRSFSALSGGQRQRVLIARALASGGEILILDEPTANIDRESETHFFDLLRGLNKRMTIMMVTHDLDLLWRAANRVAVLGEGRILGSGTMRELAQSDVPQIREYFYGPRGRAAREQAWKQR